MSRPRASFLSRSGILAYLRRVRALGRPHDDVLSAAIAGATKSLRQELHGAQRDNTALREKLVEADTANAALRAEVAELHDRQKHLWHEVRLLRVVLSANKSGLLERHAGAMNLDEIRRHTAAAVAAAPIALTPMPHMVVERLLPDDTYKALLDATPPDECFSDRDPIKQNFRPAIAKIAPDFTTAMWAFTEGQIVAKVLVPTLMSRFKPHIDALYAERYGSRGAEVAALPHEATSGRLMLRRRGYHLDPHVDPKRVVVTCLVYLAHPGDSETFGTQLFSLNAVPTITGTKTYYPGQAGYVSALEKTVAFTPNTAVAFLNAGAAAHGATIPESAPKKTRRLAYQFYVGPDPTGLAAITGETAVETRD